ncbi:MAG: hypothetical protein ACOX5T_05115 [Candidatus Cryptobacteroides sp.]|jgi:hypothetical protein
MNNNRKKFNQSLLIIFLLSLFLTSCTTYIESSSANSISAIFAVLGEYSLGALSLIVLLLLHCLRIAGVAASTIAIYMICCSINIGQLNPKLLLLIGIVITGVSLLTPIRNYTPKVVIAKNIVKIKNKEEKKSRKKDIIYEVILGVVIGVILIIIEKSIDFTVVK